MIDDGLPENEEMAGPKPTPETVPADEPGVQFRVDLSRGFTGWLAMKRASLAVTTCQVGKLILFGLDEEGGLWSYNRDLSEPMRPGSCVSHAGKCLRAHRVEIEHGFDLEAISQQPWGNANHEQSRLGMKRSSQKKHPRTSAPTWRFPTEIVRSVRYVNTSACDPGGKSLSSPVLASRLRKWVSRWQVSIGRCLAP